MRIAEVFHYSSVEHPRQYKSHCATLNAEDFARKECENCPEKHTSEPFAFPLNLIDTRRLRRYFRSS
jgi:hypothetical protein